MDQNKEAGQNLLSLIGLIYSASEDAALWPVVLDGIADAIDGEQIALFSARNDLAASNVAGPARMASTDSAPYMACCGSPRAVAERCESPFPTGTVQYFYGRELADRPARLGPADDCLPDARFCGFGLKVPLSDPPTAYLTCLRPARKERFNEKTAGILTALLPHLQRSFRHYLQLQQAKCEAHELRSVLDVFDRAVFGLDRNGVVVLSNEQANRIVGSDDGLELVAGRLIATRPAENAELQSHITKAVSDRPSASATNTGLLLNRISEHPPFQVTVMPFASRLAGDSSQLAALVFVSDPSQKNLLGGALLGQLYGLSPTECRLADLLHEGLEVRDAAERLKMTLETARFHLKKVLAKTGARRQTELMRLMLLLPRSPWLTPTANVT